MRNTKMQIWLTLAGLFLVVPVAGAASITPLNCLAEGEYRITWDGHNTIVTNVGNRGGAAVKCTGRRLYRDVPP